MLFELRRADEGLDSRDGVVYLQWQEVCTLSPPASLHVPLASDTPQRASTAEMAADAEVTRFPLLPPICLAFRPARLSSSHSSPRDSALTLELTRTVWTGEI